MMGDGINVQEQQKSIVQKLRVGFISKKNLKLIIVVSAIVLVAITATSIWAAMSVKNTRDLYFEIEGKNMVQLYKDLKDINQRHRTKMKDFGVTTYQSRTESSLKIVPQGDNSIDEYIPPATVALINSIKLINVIEASPDHKKYTDKMSLLLNGQAVVEGSMYTDGVLFGISVPALYSKYILVEKDSIKAAFLRFGINTTINKIIDREEIDKAIQIDEVKVLSVIKELGSFITENIDKASVTMEKNVERTFFDHVIKGSSFTVKLSEQELKALLKKVVEQSSNNKAIYALTVDNYNRLMALLKSTGYLETVNSLEADMSGFATEYIDINSIQNISDQDYAAIVLEIERAIEKLSVPQGIIMKTFVDTDDNIIERAFLLPGFEDLQYNWFSISYKTDNAINDKKKAVNSNHSLLLSFGKDDLKAMSSDDKEAVGSMPDMSKDGVSILLRIVTEDKYGINFKSAELNDSNSLNLATANDEDISKLQLEVQKSVISFLLQNQDIFQGLNR